MVRRFRRPLVVLLLLLVLVWIAPWIVAATGLRNTVLARVFSDVRGTVTCQSASFGWFSPIALSDVSIVDQQGDVILSAAHVQSEKNLLALVSNTSDLGKFTIDQPEIDVTVQPSTSNVEEVFHEWIYGESEGSLGIELEVTDGIVRFSRNDDGLDVAANEIRLSRLHLVKRTGVEPTSETNDLDVQLTATVPHQPHEGQLDAAFGMRYLEGSSGTSRQAAYTATVRCDGLPLAIGQRGLDRFVPGTRASGTVSCSDLSLWWDESDESCTIQGDLQGKALRVAGPWIGSDRVEVNKLTSEADLRLSQGTLDIRNLAINSELGAVTVQGNLPLALDNWQRLADEDLTIQGNVDLVRLAKLLPDTLRIRAGTEITQGKIHCFAQSSDGHKGRTWKANLVATDLVARNGQRIITWQEPINVNLSAYRGASGPVIERATCRSKFLTIEGSGSLDQLEITAHADLAQLVTDVGRFINTAGFQLAGVVDAKFNTSVVAQRLELRGTADVTKFDVVWADTPLWREDRARAELKLSGGWKDNALATIDTARIDVYGNQEQAVVRLEKPIVDLATSDDLTLRAGYGGRFRAWPKRLASWLGQVPALPFKDSDAVKFDSLVTLDGDFLAWKSSKLTIAPLVIAGGRPGPRPAAVGCEVTADGSWNLADGRLRLQNVVAKTDGWTIRAPEFVYATGSGNAPLVIDATVQGDLAKVRPWISSGAATRPTSTMQGTLAGKVKLAQTDGQDTCVVEAHVDNFVATSATGKRWQEQRLSVDGRFAWDAANRRWSIDRASIAGKDLSADARGHVALDAAERSLDLTGSVRYDLAKLSILLQSYFGDDFEMKGTEPLTFAVRGKLPATDAPADDRAWSGLTGHAKFAWDEAEYQGFHAGRVQVDAKIADGRVDLGRIETTVNEGRVTIEPVVHLTGDGPVLTVAKGRVVSGLKITPEMCQSAIKYVLPMLADVTRAEGALSVELDRCVVPLSQPERAEVVGRLVAHKAIVSPNQVIGTLAILQRIPTLVRIEPEDVIPFQVSRGRVYHQDVTLIFGRDIQIHNSGSVGFDNTLDLLVEAPVPRGILGDRPLGESLARQRIDVRIAGTLDKPKVDQEAVRSSIAKFASGTVNDFLDKELGNALDRLLKRRRE